MSEPYVLVSPGGYCVTKVYKRTAEDILSCMNHLIILPGNSLKNKAWGEAVAEHYGVWFDSHFMLEYDHWTSGKANIDFAREEEKLTVHTATLPSDANIIIMAKSAGSLLAFMAVYHQVVVPIKCVFFGIPFDLAAENLFKDAWEPVDTFTMSAIAFHNIDDPTTSYECTKTTLALHTPQITLITTHDNDHWYGDFPAYDQYIKLSE